MGVEGSRPVVQIYLEPFKLFTESEDAVTENQYQNAITL